MEFLKRFGKKNKSLAKAAYIEEINKDDFVIIDIRDRDEIEEARIRDILYIQDVEVIKEIAQENKENKEKKVLIHCRRGGRAAAMGTKLVEMGCDNIYYFDDSFARFYEKFEIIGINRDSLRNLR